MGIRESLLNTITSVGNGDFVRIVTSAGASSKATVANLFKSFESGLSAKSSLTTSDYIRVVGSDNVSYKQGVSDVKSAMGVTTLENRFKYVSSGSFNDLQTYGMYLCQSLSNAPSTSYSSYSLIVMGDATTTKQVAYPTAVSGEAWERHYTTSTWSAWVKMPTRAEVDAIVNRYGYSAGATTQTETLTGGKAGFIVLTWGTSANLYFFNTSSTTAYVKTLVSQIANVNVSTSGLTVTFSHSSNALTKFCYYLN